MEDYLEVTEFENFLSGYKWENINIYELQTGDRVYITYIPQSQKYIDMLVPKWGNVVSVGSQLEQVFLERDGIRESAAYPNLSYYGDYSGYMWDIYRAVTTDEK